MAKLAEIQSPQKKLKETFTMRMAQLESQMHSSNPSKDTMNSVAEEFRSFRELMFGILNILQQQITECNNMVDVIETRHRRKAMLFLGVAESVNETCSSAVLDIMEKRMALKAMQSAISFCHRVGALKKGRHRPILVWFTSSELRSAVWKAKSRLKGSSITVKEFLTKPRQAVFAKARQHFGMHASKSQDGVVVIKVAGGDRCKVTNMDELNSLTAKYPKKTTIATKSGFDGQGVTGVPSKSHYLNPRCTEAIDRSPLRPRVIWGYDKVKKKCITYLYRQCGDLYSGNRFETNEDCEATCRHSEALYK